MDRVVHLYEKKYKSDISPALAKTINLAGRERMLIQKMTKELLLIANNSQSDAYIKSLQKGGSLFQSKLSELMSDVDAIKDPKLLKRIKGVQQLWDEYQEAILNTELSALGLKLFNQKEKKIIQQMSEELVAVAQQIDAKRYQINLKETQELFDSTLRALINGDKKMGVIKPSNSKVKKQLERVQSLWQEYQPIITKVDISDRGLRKAMQINMPLLRAVDKAVKLYEIN
jgi:NOL1/NOP2/fmu family ribosome biogenesis protein